MRIVTVAEGSEEIRALLEQARDEDVILRLDDGSEFMLSAIDDFDHEIVRTRRNEKLMTLLDTRARQTQTISWSKSNNNSDSAIEGIYAIYEPRPNLYKHPD